MTSGKAGVMTLLRKFTIWNVGWGWYAVALLLTPEMFLVAIYLKVWLGAPNPTVALLASAPGLFLAFALRLLNPLDGPMPVPCGRYQISDKKREFSTFIRQRVRSARRRQRASRRAVQS